MLHLDNKEAREVIASPLLVEGVLLLLLDDVVANNALLRGVARDWQREARRKVGLLLCVKFRPLL